MCVLLNLLNLYTDLSGAIDPIARDGFRYGMTFIDDYSGAIFIYFLKQKSNAVNALHKFLADAAPFGKVRRIRSDNGGEYLSEEFKSVLIKNQIYQESWPYSPHQNGTAERNWRTLFEMGTTLLIESNLSKTFWAYAVLVTLFIKNRCYNQHTKETPYYLLTKKRPDLSKLHVFSTLCYPIPKDIKRNPRSSEVISVGYDKSSPAYLVYHPKSNLVERQW